jgi:hypothetical protein
MMLPRTKQSLKSGETAVRGDQWPIFLYSGYVYDSEDPWNGLLRSEILVFVSSFYDKVLIFNYFIRQGFKHVFTSPSSVDKEPKATRSGNAYLHGMKSVTKGSLAYIATQARMRSDRSFVLWLIIPSDSVFVEFLVCILTDRHSHGLRKFLP